MGETGRSTIGIAIDLPQPWRDQLTARRAAAGDPAAAHVPAHLTLLGPTEVATGDLPAVEGHLAGVAARHRAFTLLLRGTGTFRPVTQVVFVAVAAGISECEQLHRAVLEAPEIGRDRRFPYHPHVTVAHDVPGAQLDAVFDDLAGFEARFTVDGFTLFEHRSLPADGAGTAGDGVALWWPRRGYVLAGVPAVPGAGRRP